MSTIAAAPRSPALVLQISLWIAQVLVFLAFGAAGAAKLLTPIAQLSAMMPWTGEVPEPFVRALGVIDLAGGIGVLLPALTRIKPGVTVWAALGCAALQACAIAFHIMRGEAMMTPFNLVLLALSIFIYWGRTRGAPIAARA